MQIRHIQVRQLSTKQYRELTRALVVTQLIPIMAYFQVGHDSNLQGNCPVIFKTFIFLIFRIFIVVIFRTFIVVIFRIFMCKMFNSMFNYVPEKMLHYEIRPRMKCIYNMVRKTKSDNFIPIINYEFPHALKIV